MLDPYVFNQPDEGGLSQKKVTVGSLWDCSGVYIMYDGAKAGHGYFQVDTPRAAELIKALASAADLSLRDLAGDYEATPATLPAGSVDAKGWEAVTPIDLEDEECAGDIDRFRVPGGWIYTVCHKHGDGVSTVFVPEPK